MKFFSDLVFWQVNGGKVLINEVLEIHIGVLANIESDWPKSLPLSSVAALRAPFWLNELSFR